MRSARRRSQDFGCQTRRSRETLGLGRTSSSSQAYLIRWQGRGGMAVRYIF